MYSPTKEWPCWLPILQRMYSHRVWESHQTFSMWVLLKSHQRRKIMPLMWIVGLNKGNMYVWYPYVPMSVSSRVVWSRYLPKPKTPPKAQNLTSLVFKINKSLKYCLTFLYWKFGIDRRSKPWSIEVEAWAENGARSKGKLFSRVEEITVIIIEVFLVTFIPQLWICF